MPEITIADERIHYKRWGNDGKRALLAIHGSGGSHRQWPETLQRILDHTDVLLIDLPGHGGSGGAGRNSIAAYAEFISRFVETLNLGRVILMGHSLGGAVVQSIAMELPKWLEGIVLVGTGAKLRVNPAILDGLKAHPNQAFEFILKALFGPGVSTELVDQIRQGFLLTPAEVTFNDFLACDRFDARPSIGQIDCPALILSGEADRLTPVKYGAYLEKAIQGSRHVVLPNAGHMMALEDPEGFTDAVGAFLKNL